MGVYAEAGRRLSTKLRLSLARTSNPVSLDRRSLLDIRPDRSTPLRRLLPGYDPNACSILDEIHAALLGSPTGELGLEFLGW